MEEVLTFIWRQGKLGRGPWAEGRQCRRGQDAGSIWPELSFASALRVCAGRCRMCSGRGTRASPACSRPCRFSAQKPLSLLFNYSGCCLQGLGVRALGPHATAHRTRGPGIPGRKISGLVRVTPTPTPRAGRQHRGLKVGEEVWGRNREFHGWRGSRTDLWVMGRKYGGGPYWRDLGDLQSQRRRR